MSKNEQSAEEIKQAAEKKKPTLSDAELTGKLKLEKAKAVIGKIILYPMAIIAILSVFRGKIGYFILFMAIAMIAATVSTSAGKKLKTLTSDNLIRGALETVFDNVVYEPFSKMPGPVIDEAHMDFPFRYNKIDGNDHIKATYKGLNIEMADVTLIEETVTMDDDGNMSTTETNRFVGLWLVCDFGKELSADLRLSERGKFGKIFGGRGVKTENDAFNKRFCITTDVEVEAFYILTPHMMEYILSMDDRGDGDTYISFLRSGKVHIAINSGRDSFEIGKTKVSDPSALRQKFVDEIRYVTDLIDELQLVDTLYKK